MNILFVVPRLPYPLDAGGKIRTYNLLKQAADVHRVTLLSFVFGDEPIGYRSVFRDFGVPVVSVYGRDAISAETAVTAMTKNLPLSVAKYRSYAMAQAIIREVRQGRIDLVHFDHIHMGQYLRLLPGVPAVVDEHNVECLILKRLAQHEKNLAKKIAIGWEYEKMRSLERKVCRKAFRVFVVSGEDGRNLAEISGGGVKYEVIPNGVDTEYFRISNLEPQTSGENALVFTGSMDWVPNSDAVLYFSNEILPLIWKERPDVQFYVVGKNPPESVMALERKDRRIVVTGGVADVRPYEAQAKVFVVPLRIGGGTRLKILEAMSMARPVLSTTIGAEGIGAKEGVHLELADKPEDFAAKALSLLRDETRRRLLGENGRKFVCERYDWKIIGKKAAEVYEQLVPVA